MAAESAPPEQGTALTVWAEQDHDFYYPRADATIPQADALSAVKLIGRDWDKTSAKTHMDVMKTVIKKQFRNKKEPGKFPLRTKFADIPVNGLEQTILTNHLEFTIHDTLLYEYEILDLEAGGQSRKKIQALFRKAIAQWPFLKDDQDSFATDGQKTIVSWKKLHGSMDESKLVYQGAGKDHEGSIWQEDIPGAKSTSLPVRFNYVGPVNVADLLKQTQCDLSKITADLSSVERCINILISKSFNNSVVKLSGKKFFVRSARDDLGGSQSLEIIRGYYYAVRPSVGNLLLNFNVATSAFFRPILVSEFLNDGSTFGKQGERLSLLMRLRVYVEHEHADKRLNRLGARIKTIQAVGDDEGRNIEDLFFHKKQIGAEGKPFKLPNDEWAREAKPTYVTQHHLDGKTSFPDPREKRVC
jgi:eukaryotic translation initiation factor 2C